MRRGRAGSGGAGAAARRRGCVQIPVTIPTFQNPTGRTSVTAAPACAGGSLPGARAFPSSRTTPTVRSTTRARRTRPCCRWIPVGSPTSARSPKCCRRASVWATWYRRRPCPGGSSRPSRQAICTAPRVLQRVVFEIVKDGFLDGHLQTTRALYSRHAEALEASLRTHLSEHAQWQAPAGGMFLWLRLNSGLDAQGLLETCPERGCRLRARCAVFCRCAGSCHPAPMLQHRGAGGHRAWRRGAGAGRARRFESGLTRTAALLV